ncbi:hypothetical protein BD769DRAFT_1779090 [Suillus cothurnatus]|nr:hypothetical protein BD769DRAFT_1779090 [Suillus cothurnatus]
MFGSNSHASHAKPSVISAAPSKMSKLDLLAFSPIEPMTINTWLWLCKDKYLAWPPAGRAKRETLVKLELRCAQTACHLSASTANIDVNQRNSGYAYGSLYPEYCVDDVDKLFGTVLKKISEKILSCYEEHMEGARRARGTSSGFAEDGDQEVVEEPEPDVELSDLSSISDSDEEIDEAPDEDQLAVTIASLSNWQPTLPVVDWRELKNTLITGIWNTAYSRYRSWHERLKKRDVQEAFDDQEYHNERRRDERHHDEEPRMTRSMTKRLRPHV